MDSLSENTSNNPRVDLLHGGGDLQQLAAKEEPVAPAPPPPPAPEPQPVPEPQPLPDLPAPRQPDPALDEPMPSPSVTMPDPRPAPPSSAPSRTRWPLIIGLIVLLLLAAGGAAWWFLLRPHTDEAANPTPAPQEVSLAAPSELQQVDSSGATLDKAKATKQKRLTFRFAMATSANTGSLTPELELKPADAPFTGEPTLTGQPVSANGRDMQFEIQSQDLADGAYHWQVRLTKADQHGDWAVFGGDPAAAAFSIDTAAPTAPALTTVDNKKSTATVNVATNKPVFSGTAEPNAVIALTVGPDNLSFNTTADATGHWTLTPAQDIPNGSHQVSLIATDGAGNASTPAALALAVNPAAAAPVAATPATPATPAQPPAPAATRLAPTGDPIIPITFASLLVGLIAVTGLLWARRRYEAS
jgi:hypothetical protein